MPEKKRYFKKEKKQLKPKRHKAKSEAQLKAEEKKGLRRGVQVEEKPSTSSGKKKFWTVPRFSGKRTPFSPFQNDKKLQFPKISRFITEWFGYVRANGVGKSKTKLFDEFTFGSFFKASTFGNFSKKQIKRAKRKNFWMSILLVGSLLFAGFLSLQLWVTYTMWQQTQGEYKKLQRELVIWENVTKQYPTYRDAYFEAAVLAYRLGENEKEADYLQKALDIDPNFQPAIELKKLLK